MVWRCDETWLAAKLDATRLVLPLKFHGCATNVSTPLIKMECDEMAIFYMRVRRARGWMRRRRLTDLSH